MNKTFYSDSTGAQYQAKLNFQGVRKVKQELGLDLLDAEHMVQAVTSPIVALDVLYLVSSRVNGPMPDLSQFCEQFSGRRSRGRLQGS